MAWSNDCRHKRSLYLWKSNQTKAVVGLPQRSRYEINSTSSLLFTISQIMVRIGDGLKLNHPGMEIATSIRWWMEQFRIRGTSDALLDINPTQLTTRFLPSFLSSSPHKHCANISSLMTYPTSTPNGHDTGLKCCRMGCNIFWRLTGCTKIMNSA